MARFTTRRRVEFADTDMGGIMHFSRYFVFMETAEHLFLESLGTSVALEQDGQPLGWPRVSVTCEYRSPARFGEWIDIAVDVARQGTKSMTYEFRFTREGEELATGRVVAVCCLLGPGGVRSIPIPDEIASRLQG